MKRKVLAVTLAVFLLVPSLAVACTTIIVGRQVSADGSFIFGRTDDTHTIGKEQIVSVPAQTTVTPPTFVDAYNGFTMELPKESCQYVMTPRSESAHTGIWAESALNEYQVAISATETIIASDTALAADPYIPNGIAESNIPTLVIPYVKTAREGIERLGELVDLYGSTEGNGVLIADPTEAWYIEIYTGHQWLAIKLPQDKVAVIPNAAVLGCVDVADTENVLASADLWKLPTDKGFLSLQDGKPHAALTYGTDRFTGHMLPGNQYRFWGGRAFLAPSQTGDIDLTAYYDAFFTPDKKVTLADCMELMRYRYEGTANATETNPKNRPIGVNYTEAAHLFWQRPHMPTVMWVALANPEFSVFLPLYGNLTQTPAPYTLDTLIYNDQAAYYRFRGLSNLCIEDRIHYGADVRKYWKAMETLLILDMQRMDQLYLTSGKDGNTAAKLFADIAQRALDAAGMLYNQVMEKRIQRMDYAQDDFLSRFQDW